MTEVLLKELSSSDIDWMATTGRQTEIAAGTVLIQAGKAVDALHILLDGALTVSISQAGSDPLARAFTAIEGNDLSRELARLSSGEVVGEIPLVSIHPATTTVKALEKSLVLSIPQRQLAAKLQEDVGFAARFYRAISILLSDKLQRIVRQLNHSKLDQSQPLKDILFVLGELNDSDLDWLIAAGSRQRIAANTVLIQAGGPVDALYILLGGTMAAFASADERNPLARAFTVLEGGRDSDREIARLSKGEIVGETPFIDARLPEATVKAIKETLVLSIPRQKLAAKLQQDVGFASRFYRVIATLLANRLQGMLARLGYGRRVYRKGQSLDEAIEYEDELDLRMLDQMALAGTRFDWMLARLSGR